MQWGNDHQGHQTQNVANSKLPSKTAESNFQPET